MKYFQFKTNSIFGTLHVQPLSLFYDGWVEVLYGICYLSQSISKGLKEKYNGNPN